MEQIDFSEAPLCRNRCEIQVFARWLLDRVATARQVAHCVVDTTGRVVAHSTGWPMAPHVTTEQKEGPEQISRNWQLLVSLPDSVAVVTLPHGAHLATFSFVHCEVVLDFPSTGTEPSLRAEVGDTLLASTSPVEVPNLDDKVATREFLLDSVSVQFGAFLSRPASGNPLIGVGFVEDGLLSSLSVRAAGDELADVEDARARAAIRHHLRTRASQFPSIVMVDGPKAVVLGVVVTPD